MLPPGQPAEIQIGKDAIRRALGGADDSFRLADDLPTLGESPDPQIVRVGESGGFESDSPYAYLAVSDFMAGLRGPVPEVRTSTFSAMAHAYAVIIAEHFGGTVLTPKPRDLTPDDLQLPPGVQG